MTSLIEAAIHKDLTDLTKIVRWELNCNVLPYEFTSIADFETDRAKKFQLSMLLADLHTDLASLKATNKPTFICCLPVEIDGADKLVSPSHGHLSDWDFEAWLEQEVLKTQVLSVGSVTHEGHRFRTFKWLVQGPVWSNTTPSEGKYVGILSYFEKHPFGTEMPVLSLLSTLPPRDRCAILEVIRAKDPSNVEVYNKLSMAYLKNEEEDKAHTILQQGLVSGALDEYTHQQLEEKITFLKTNMHMSPAQEVAARRRVHAAEVVTVLRGDHQHFEQSMCGRRKRPLSGVFALLIELCKTQQSG